MIKMFLSLIFILIFRKKVRKDEDFYENSFGAVVTN